jgi:DNA-binding transcriptional LysR family regulator
MNKFSDMATFVAVVEAASISEAARRLGATKSIVSERITQLERYLGCALLQRGRPLRTTEPGLIFYKSALQILEEVSCAEESVRDVQASLRGALRIVVPTTLLASHLGPVLASFAAKHPDLCLDVEAQNRVGNLQDGQYDVAIRTGELPDSRLVARTVTANHTFVCASPSYLERRGTPEHPGDLVHHDGLNNCNYEPNGMWNLQLEGKARSFRIGRRMRADSGTVLLEGVRAGLGLAILPTFMVADLIVAGEIVPVLQSYAPSGGRISAVYRKTVGTPPRIKVLVDHLIAEIEHPARWDTQLINAGLLRV